MGGGAWPFLVGGLICLVYSDNERDLSLLNSPANRLKWVGSARRPAFTSPVASAPRVEPGRVGTGLLRGTTRVKREEVRQKQVCDALRCLAAARALH